jgi:hypothetical protein
MIHLSTTVLAIIAGTLIPSLTTIMSKEKAATWLKGLIAAILSTAGGVTATALANGGNLAWEALVGSSAIAVTTALVTHFLPQATDTIKTKTARFGLG